MTASTSAPATSAFLSISAAAPILDMSEGSFRDNYKAGVWPFTELVQKVGGRYKVSRYKLDKFARGELKEPERG